MIAVRLSKYAADYIRRETQYLRERNPQAARKFGQTIKEARRMLQSFPETGTRTHGLQIAHGRTLVAGDYLLDYLFEAGRVDVLTIRHARMATLVPALEIDEEVVSEDSEPPN